MFVSATCKSLVAAVVVVFLLAAEQRASAALGTLAFQEPGGWSVGDANSTHQAWDSFSGTAGAAPDLSYEVFPTGLTMPTAGVLSPGFRTGSQNYYSFSGNYGVELDIFNHGGATGTSGGLGGGTYVTVQAASTIGAGAGTIIDSLELVKQDGTSLLGGSNGEALAEAELFRGIVPTIMGDQDYQQYAWRFFLPDWTGDFRVQWDQTIHSSLDAVRVDSFVTDQPFSVVPEPASAALMGVVMVGLAMRRQRRRVAR